MEDFHAFTTRDSQLGGVAFSSQKPNVVFIAPNQVQLAYAYTYTIAPITRASISRCNLTLDTISNLLIFYARFLTP